MNYVPDKWVILKIQPKDKPAWYRLFAGWYGGFAQGDSWRANSGITSIDFDNDLYLVYGNSGSVYRCWKNMEGLSRYMDSVLYGYIMTASEHEVIIQTIPMTQAIEELNEQRATVVP